MPGLLFRGLQLIVCILYTMLNTVVLRSSALARHRGAPLLRKRESYLDHLERLGQSRQKRRDAASYLVQVVRRLELKQMRKVKLEELRVAADLWHERSDQSRSAGCRGRASFLRYAKGLLKFHGCLIEPRKWNAPFDGRVELFERYMQCELGFAPRTIENRIWGINRFLSWLADDQVQLRSVGGAHIEKYLDYLAKQDWKSTTIASTAQALKVFFRFAERRRWSRRGVSDGIFGPLIDCSAARRSGPEWKDVCRLVKSARGTTANDYRAGAILLLLSVYALRANEISHLTLADIDFKDGVLTIRRSKNHLVQRLPLNMNVRIALRNYIFKARPKSDHAQVFLSLRRPHGPIFQASLYNITKTRMRRLGMNPVNKGPHSLRYACANHLLTVGAPVGKVASLLGHRSLKYVGSYAQHTISQLRSVAEFDLRGLCELE
jgi:integrase/recombinase XerD